MARKKQTVAAQATTEEAGKNGKVARPRNRNEMYYCVVGTSLFNGSFTILAVQPTVGKARKLYASMSAAFSAAAKDCRIIRCVVVPFIRPEGEPEE